MGTIRITVDGRVACTVEQLAERHGLAASSVRAIIAREKIRHVEQLDGRKKLYLATAFATATKARPGKGRAVGRGGRLG